MVVLPSNKINQTIKQYIMKKIALLSVLFLLTINSHAQFWGNNTIKGNGEVTTVTRTTSNYDGVKCAGSFNFILVSGNEGNITIEGESNLIEHIITEVKNNQLIIKPENGMNLRPSRKYTITVTIPVEGISEVSLAGSGKLWNEQILTSNELSVQLAGSGDMNLSLANKMTTAKIAGSGNLNLSGNTTDLKLDLSGSGRLNAYELIANNVEASVAGSGDVRINCQDNLKAKVAGSGDIVYKGNPKTENTNVAGSGSIKKAN
ncbi:DUF2807 domain-containing protein [Paucihalobacter ruber]|uniref:DUF2807 domain-containing protein n=2 Tax=Paucihalobacter ruber TaxID=2567861 RepID=A0A506PJF5_9FLAO|nr:DUF2807 domain-containing protein [Paucihalobacter ruber]